MKKTGKALAEYYKLDVQSAHYHFKGNWYWTLMRFPGLYFDASGYVSFPTKKGYLECRYLNIGLVNTSVRNKEAGISGIPGYTKLDPAPSSL